MTCKQLVELVTDYLEGALPPDERARLEAHLAECVGCEIYVRQMRATIAALGALNEQDISPQAQAKLARVFRQWRGLDLSL